MLQRFALAAAVAISSASALESTMLDMSMYNDVIFAQIKTEQVGDESKSKPVCTLRVHSVSPVLDVPKVPQIDLMPSFLKRRLARRYQDRGEAVPEYLKDEADSSIDKVMGEVTKKLETEKSEAAVEKSAPKPAITKPKKVVP